MQNENAKRGRLCAKYPGDIGANPSQELAPSRERRGPSRETIDVLVIFVIEMPDGKPK
jgi:hypothetical protein